MTAKEFDKTMWYSGINVLYDKRILEVMSVNFYNRKLLLKGEYGYITVSHLKCKEIYK